MSLWDAYKSATGMNMLNSFLNPGQGYEDAAKEARRGWDEAQGYERPYWQHGLDQYGRLQGAEDKLLDPAALQNEWAKGYQTSPYANQLLEQNRTNGLDAASSMGMMGSSAALGNIQQGAGNIVAQDRENYMNQLMNKYLAGIGIGSNIYGTGAQMGANLGNQRMALGRDLAGLAYGQAAAPGNLLERMLGTGAGLGMNYATGGGYGAMRGAQAAAYGG